MSSSIVVLGSAFLFCFTERGLGDRLGFRGKPLRGVLGSGEIWKWLVAVVSDEFCLLLGVSRPAS